MRVQVKGKPRKALILLEAQKCFHIPLWFYSLNS